MGRAFALYTGLRAVAFAVCCGVLLVLGVPIIGAVLVGLLLSSLFSLLGLRRQREAFVEALQRHRDQRSSEQARLRAMLDQDPTTHEGQPGR